MNGQVVSVNISTEKGTIKTPVPVIEIDKSGVVGDAHAGDWHRQVSLLAKESIELWSKDAGRKPSWGEFAENITTEGLVLYEMNPGDKLRIGEVELEVTQIGKKCHGTGCAIFREVGNCVMPKEGIFAKVMNYGSIRAGDKIVFLEKKIPNQSV